MLKQIITGCACLFLFAFTRKTAETYSTISPLHAYSAEWDQPKYQKCNTASKEKYLTKEEKDVCWILNMARVNPALFAKTVVKQFPELGGQGWLVNIDEYKSLLDTMQKIKPLRQLYPDSLCWESARCHAETSGNLSYTGHERMTDECRQKRRFFGECCDYGYKEPLYIIMHLLIDQGVPSLGHRYLILSGFSGLGVSIQPHKRYGYNAVLDFY